MGLFDLFKAKNKLPVEKNHDVEPLKGIRSYTITSGDNLPKLAKQFYGDASAWEKIYEANHGLITDPKKLYIGQQIIIP